MEEKKVCFVDVENERAFEIEIQKISGIRKCQCCGLTYIELDNVYGITAKIGVKQEFSQVFKQIAKAYGPVSPDVKDYVDLTVRSKETDSLLALRINVNKIDNVFLEDDGFVVVGVQDYGYSEYSYFKIREDLVGFATLFAQSVGESEVQND
ncbi:MAG: hypothetical protein E7353_06755 [Clostridiales bacterium]|nr:hypothetical protein [Clostridiales bacterium]